MRRFTLTFVISYSKQEGLLINGLTPFEMMTACAALLLLGGYMLFLAVISAIDFVGSVAGEHYLGISPKEGDTMSIWAIMLRIFIRIFRPISDRAIEMLIVYYPIFLFVAILIASYFGWDSNR